MAVARALQLAAAVAILIAAVAVSFGGFGSPSRPRSDRASQKVFECTKNNDRSRYTVIESTEDTKGERVVIRELIRAGSPGFSAGRSGSPPPHIHKHEEECFVVHSGSFSYLLDGVEGHLKRGEPPACIPAGRPHYFWNSNNSTDLDMQFTLTPAGKFESFIRTFCGLASDAGTVEHVNPLRLMVLFVGGGMEIADMPRPVWLFIERAVVPLLRALRIFQPTYPEYTS